MSLFSSKSSSKSQTANSGNTDSYNTERYANVSTNSGGQAVGVGGRIVNTNIDTKAITALLDAGVKQNASAAITARETVAEMGDVTQSGFELASDGLDFAQNVSESGFDFAAQSLDTLVNANADVSQAGIDLAREAVKKVSSSADLNVQIASQLAETSQANLGQALDRFGQDIASIKRIDVTNGASETNDLTKWIVGALVLLGVMWAWMRGKN